LQASTASNKSLLDKTYLFLRNHNQVVGTTFGGLALAAAGIMINFKDDSAWWLYLGIVFFILGLAATIWSSVAGLEREKKLTALEGSQQQLETLRTRYKRLFEHQLKLLADKLNLPRDVRVTVYEVVPGDRVLPSVCVMRARHSRHGLYKSSGRLGFLTYEGCVGVAASSTDYIIDDDYPDPQSDINSYNSYVNKQSKWHLKEQIVKGFTMKSRSYAAFRITDNLDMDTVAVVVFESTKPELEVDEGELVRYVNDEKNRIREFVSLMKEVEPVPDATLAALRAHLPVEREKEAELLPVPSSPHQAQPVYHSQAPPPLVSAAPISQPEPILRPSPPLPRYIPETMPVSPAGPTSPSTHIPTSRPASLPPSPARQPVPILPPPPPPGSPPQYSDEVFITPKKASKSDSRPASKQPTDYLPRTSSTTSFEFPDPIDTAPTASMSPPIQPALEADISSERPRPGILNLFDEELIHQDQTIYIRHKGKIYEAKILGGSQVKYRDQVMSYSQWGKVVTGWKSINIFEHARVLDKGVERRLEELRRDLEDLQQQEEPF
jgi:hypothetical protein